MRFLRPLYFSKEVIHKIIRNLDPNKARAHDMISIRMIKLWAFPYANHLK